ncbi:hypothetical protein AMC82_PD00823 (plasmid) [Rhizobium phaseoli]|uniref:hypothetical protein n=1 Tax=Rhizobium phaseoli TaxID=396 RepID=UPI0007F0CFD9|nr:hypothetical protein AMC84_PD00826 [Rhizobium phaseoli]ANL76222.1 hypothetical protein AMC83_PE00813 [Rhizobium phaseoli]ANL82578.1 hypothetical protein AMC82_PD00823 [Rhizobium phaseoli]PDS68162.1 hypothetical protein CO651_30665 [Rhizobium phaseoli]
MLRGCFGAGFTRMDCLWRSKVTTDDTGRRRWHPDFDSSLLNPSGLQGVTTLGRSDPTPPHLWGSVLLLGNFDGLHIGHRSLLAVARHHAAALGAPVGIMSCEPHPKQFFTPNADPFRLGGAAPKRVVCNRFSCETRISATKSFGDKPENSASNLGINNRSMPRRSLSGERPERGRSDSRTLQSKSCQRTRMSNL